jgi:hypothetical protein
MLKIKKNILNWTKSFTIRTKCPHYSTQQKIANCLTTSFEGLESRKQWAGVNTKYSYV